MGKRSQYVYGGYGRYLYVIASQADEAAVLPILQAFQKRRYRLYYAPAEGGRSAMDRIDAASAVLVFVSDFIERDGALFDTLSYATCAGKPIISIAPDKRLPGGAFGMLLNTWQTLAISDYPDMDAFYEKLFSSGAVKKLPVAPEQLLRRLRTVGGVLGAICLLIAVLALGGYLLIARLLSPFEKKPAAAAQETAAQAGAAASVAADTPAMAAIQPGAPLTKEGLSEIQGVWIIGSTFVEPDAGFEDPQQANTIARGSIGDLSDLQQFPNLTSVRIYRQSEPLDLAPLFQCKNLRRIYIRDARVESFEGLEQLKQLSVLSLINCGTVDLTPLGKCDFSYADDASGGFRLVLTDTALTDYAALGGVAHYKALITSAAVSSIAPALRNCERIDEMVCTNVSRMSAFGALPCVVSLFIEDDRVTTLAGMEGLSGLTSLSVSGGLQQIGDVGAMPNLRSLTTGGASMYNSSSENVNRLHNSPINHIDGLAEAFPNLEKASMPNLTATERSKLTEFLEGNQ